MINSNVKAVMTVEVINEEMQFQFFLHPDLDQKDLVRKLYQFLILKGKRDDEKES